MQAVHKTLGIFNMAPGTHLIISWLSSVALIRNRRERVLITLSGVAPDIDGIGLILDKQYFFKYHHVLCHSLLSAFIIASIACALSKSQKIWVFLFSFLMVHVHLFCDLIGAKGPDGFQWPITYLYPSTALSLTWSGQWELNAWQNQVILILSFILTIVVAKRKGYTFLEVFSQKLDSAAFNLYHRYFSKKT